MDQDLAMEISRVRNILRKALHAGCRCAQSDRALARLQELARHGDDGSLEFEHLRWRYHLANLTREPGPAA